MQNACLWSARRLTGGKHEIRPRFRVLPGDGRLCYNPTDCASDSKRRRTQDYRFGRSGLSRSIARQSDDRLQLDSADGGQSCAGMCGRAQPISKTLRPREWLGSAVSQCGNSRLSKPDRKRSEWNMPVRGKPTNLQKKSSRTTWSCADLGIGNNESEWE